MTERTAPLLDSRSAAGIYRLVKARTGMVGGSVDPLGEGLLRVFARYCDLVIDRLNRAPDKHYLAFLELLGVSRIPPVPATVPLTFQPVKTLPSGKAPVSVPAGTRVVAPPPPGQSEPIVFETLRPAELTSAVLRRILVLDPSTDQYADRSAWATETCEDGPHGLEGDRPVVHELSIGHSEAFGPEGISRLRLDFDVTPGAGLTTEDWELAWRLPSGEGECVLEPQEDTTRGLRCSGRVVFADLPPWPVSTIGGRKGRWLCCRLKTPLSHSGSAAEPRHLPRIARIASSAFWQVETALVEAACYNSLQLDISKDFFPFGSSPRFGDSLYLACPLFCRARAQVALKIQLTNPAGGGLDAPLPAVSTSGRAKVQWEAWDGETWLPIPCSDKTESFTVDGEVRLELPASAPPALVNGIEGGWLRGRLVAGNYGEEERIAFVDPLAPEKGFRRVPSSLAPPAIASMKVSARISVEARLPEAILLQNNLGFDEVEPAARGSFAPFRIAEPASTWVLLGFEAATAGALGDRAFDLYLETAAPQRWIGVGDREAGAVSEARWEFSGPDGWLPCEYSDETFGLTRSGRARVRPGPQIAPWSGCAIGDERLYWLRGLVERTPGVTHPLVRGLFPNTVLARQSLTLKDEILGSGTGLPSQRLHCTRAPILGEVHLEVREPEPPPSGVLSGLRRVLRTEPVRLLKDDRDRITECWVRWQEVEDFYSSTQEDRHFTVDRQRGLIQFGDGVRGCTPPSGTNSIVLRRYAVGGGAVGNLPAGSITKLRTTVPFVDSVANRVASVGGCDIESWDALRDRGSRRLRHRYRAVTAEDYEDLARLASPAVARTRCYPARDLRRHRGSPSDCPGVVSLIVIPHGEEPAPRPDLALQRLVWDFLSPYRLPDTRLLVCGVEYLAIGVEVEVEVSADAAWRTVVEDCTRSLRRFLHPLTGGVHGHGWPFGRRPHRSDFFPVLESIPGLEYVHTLELVFPPQLTELMQSGAFLVCSGEHRIRLVDGTARQPGKGDSYHAS